MSKDKDKSVEKTMTKRLLPDGEKDVEMTDFQATKKTLTSKDNNMMNNNVWSSSSSDELSPISSNAMSGKAKTAKND